jgi:hypothetical protein
MTAERAPAQHEDAPILENQLTTRAFTEARPRSGLRCRGLQQTTLRLRSACLSACCCGPGLRSAREERADSVNALLELCDI